MDASYSPEQWRDVFAMLGTSASALVGLLFVVVTLHFEKIHERADENMRVTMQGARFNMYHLLTVMVESVIVLVPQPLAFTGGELIAVNLFGLRLPLTIIARYAGRITISERGGFPTVLIATIIVAYLLGVAGGTVPIGHPLWGLYMIVLSCVIKIVRSVLTAWMHMFGMSYPAHRRISDATPPRRKFWPSQKEWIFFTALPDAKTAARSCAAR